jgi:N-acetyltransferase 10
MPDILCAVQLALEGNLSGLNINENSQRGIKPSGDLIPWNVR